MPNFLETIISALPLLLLGASLTLKITVLAVAFGTVLGLFAGLARLYGNPVIRLLAVTYIDFFRGTPLLVQIFMVYFGLPQLLMYVQDFTMAQWGFVFFKTTTIDRFVAAVVACSLNSGAYIAEIFRAGVQSIEKGQMEAARSLGMTQNQSLRYVILPQAFKRVIPPLGNEFIAMLKDTSLLSIIGIAELFRNGQLIVAVNWKPFEIYFAVAIIYLIMTFTFSRLVDYLERRLKTG